MKTEKTNLLKNLGIYGYEHFEPLIIAALVTESPLLLIGKAGTGKSFLLNSLSKALNLNHRHYNASLISFDDLIGFPYPEENGTAIRYIETPATVWQAESVLIDEISRCKSEHQNRLFSLIHERRIQGMKLKKLRFCWAAMNPSSVDQGVEDYYEGSVPLDQALADRFAFIIEVPDWKDLSEQDRDLIATPQEANTTSADKGELADTVKESKARLPAVEKRYLSRTIEYSVVVTNALKQKNIRLSPRRVRQLTKNLLALTAVKGGKASRETFLLCLKTSIPQPAWGVILDEATLRAAHELAWSHAFNKTDEKWFNAVSLESRIPEKINKIITQCPDPDTGSIIIARTLAELEPVDRAIFAFSLYPAILKGVVDLGNEGLAHLAKAASPILEVDSNITWQERRSEENTQHPQLDSCARVLTKLQGSQKTRARQLFYYLVGNGIPFSDPAAIENTLNQCIKTISPHLKTQKIHD